MIAVTATDDLALIRSIMMHPDILPAITDDTWDGRPLELDPTGFYLVVFADGKIIGIYHLHWINGVTLQGHAHILKEHRKQYSLDSIKAVYAYILQNVRRCHKVACDVPVVYKNVIRFLEVSGFSLEGNRRYAFKLDDRLHDVAIYGITADEMKKVIE